MILQKKKGLILYNADIGLVQCKIKLKVFSIRKSSKVSFINVDIKLDVLKVYETIFSAL